jgi:hypothetical protein
MLDVINNDTVSRQSTEAAREYVRVVRARLQMELARYGHEAQFRRSFQQLERSITPEELQRTWPYADIDAASAR